MASVNWYKKSQYSVEDRETHPLPALSGRGDNIVETEEGRKFVSLVPEEQSALEIIQKMLGLRKHKPKTKYHECPKCGNPKCYYKEIHPDTDMNEIVEYCPVCGEIE